MRFWVKNNNKLLKISYVVRKKALFNEGVQKERQIFKKRILQASFILKSRPNQKDNNIFTIDI